MSIYLANNIGVSDTHQWDKYRTVNGFCWYVTGVAEWTISGYAMVDDFGDLVEVV